MDKRKFLRSVGGLASGSIALSVAGCISKGEETSKAETPPEIPSFHASHSNIVSEIETLERTVHELTNKFREEEGHDFLEYNEDLAKIARNHSRNMAKKGYFAHEDHNNRGPGARADYFGYPNTAISENLFRVGIPEQVDSADRVAARAIRGWKSSSSHRAGMLTTAHIVEGVGAYITEERSVFITTMFADVDGEISS